MINKTIARRYAQALFDIAREQKAVEKFSQDLNSVLQSIEGNEDISKVISSRLVNVTAKKDLCKTLLAADINPMVANFLFLVLDKQREGYLQPIVEVFDELVARENKILPARVRTAQQMTEEQVKMLEDKLSKMTGQNVKTTVDVDPSLIGGMAVKIGDIVYDGSIAKQLGMMKTHLQQVQLGR